MNMHEGAKQDLSGVAETLLIAVYIRAMESQRPAAGQGHGHSPLPARSQRGGLGLD
jgi:hypothetical protein